MSGILPIPVTRNSRDWIWPVSALSLITYNNTNTVVGAEDGTLALDTGKVLPENACLLTFDDGYLGHYITVFPELARRGWSGAFYPPVVALHREQVMEVNKIHLILAKKWLFPSEQPHCGIQEPVYCPATGTAEAQPAATRAASGNILGRLQGEV